MKKFLISTILTFISLFIVVSGIAYYFYERIADGYIDSEISNTLFVTTSSTNDILKHRIEHDKETLEHFYLNNKDLNINQLNIKKNDTELLVDVDYEFVLYDHQKVIFTDKVLEFKSSFPSSLFKDNFFFVINTKEAFDEGNEEILFFSFGEVMVAIDAEDYFSCIIGEFIDTKPHSFIIDKTGYIHYQTDLVKAHRFFKDYLSATSANLEKEDFLEKLQNNESGVVNNFLFNLRDAHIVYIPMVIGGVNEYYFITVHYEKELTNITDSLTIPLLIMFICLTTVLLVGTVLIYILVLRKNDDIEASKLALYYSKPFVLKINRDGKIAFKNDTFGTLNIDWEKYPYVYNFSTIDNELDILGAIKRRKAIRIQMDSVEGVTYTFFMMCVKSNLKTYLVGENITSEYERTVRLNEESRYDKITLLPNKRVLLEDIDSQLVKVKSSNNELKNSLIMFSIEDLDRYGKIFGSKMVDKITVKFSELVTEMLDQEMKLYRLEKDVFAILFKKLNEFSDVVEWINNLRDSFRKPVEIDENQLVIDTQHGIFNIDLNLYEDLDSLKVFECSEIAFAHAKSLSSADYVIYNISLGRLVKREQLMEDDLLKAIKEEEFIVYVQPQYNTTKNKIIGFEALTRWNNENYLSDSPQHFIEIAEKNNMIIPIGNIIANQAFGIAKKLENEDITIAINISPAQLVQNGFVNQMVELAEKHQVDPSKIALEVTETFLVENLRIAREKLLLLKKRGFKIHLDDFGTGYSSLAYLKDLPVDTIKIDREFIKYLNTDKTSRAIVSKFLSLANALELEVIAEGVEDEKQSAFLNKNGCEIIQGWLISKALPFDEAMKLLEQYNGKDKKNKKEGGKE